jgi:hypothetical protein
LPRDGNENIDEEQAFLLALDAPADPASLKDAWCEAAGINERIPLTILTEKETRELIAANRYGAYDLFRAYFKGDRRMVPIARFKVEDKRFAGLPVVAVRCARRLPAGPRSVWCWARKSPRRRVCRARRRNGLRSRSGRLSS